MLTDTLFKALYEERGKVFTLVETAGPSTLRLRAALTQAKGANVPLRTVTTVVPQARAIGNVVGLAADTAMTVGSATVEMDLRDSISDERLAAVVDERTGTKALFAKRAYTTWGDVDEACQFWAKTVTWQIARQGVQRQPGVAMPQQPKPSRSL